MQRVAATFRIVMKFIVRVVKKLSDRFSKVNDAFFVELQLTRLNGMIARISLHGNEAKLWDKARNAEPYCEIINLSCKFFVNPVRYSKLSDKLYIYDDSCNLYREFS